MNKDWSILYLSSLWRQQLIVDDLSVWGTLSDLRLFIFYFLLIILSIRYTLSFCYSYLGSRLDTSANHVVAALKYNITRSNSLPSLVKPPLIRPATFLYNSKNTRVETPTLPPPVINKDNKRRRYDDYDSATSTTVCKQFFFCFICFVFLMRIYLFFIRIKIVNKK